MQTSSALETRAIGSLQVTVVGLGCNNFGWRIDDPVAAEVVGAAIAAGINFFDTADIYGEGRSEEFLGRALGERRHEVVVATKFGMKMDDERRGARPEYAGRAVLHEQRAWDARLHGVSALAGSACRVRI